jgi:phosphoribosylanthranilate isomerase
MMKIKICGLTRPQDIEAVNEAMPDFAGFVFAPSKRRIDRHTARVYKSRLNPRIKTVGVFVNETPEFVAELCGEGIIDLVQLHGEEDDAYISTLRTKVPNEIIRAVRVKDARDLQAAKNLTCDYLLLDAFSPGHTGVPAKHLTGR